MLGFLRGERADEQRLVDLRGLRASAPRARARGERRRTELKPIIALARRARAHANATCGIVHPLAVAVASTRRSTSASAALSGRSYGVPAKNFWRAVVGGPAGRVSTPPPSGPRLPTFAARPPRSRVPPPPS